MRSSPQLSGRPEVYEPDSVYYTTLYFLHLRLNFDSRFEIPREGPSLKGCRLKRDDGVMVNYFQTIQDKKEDVYPTLGEWLSVYSSLIEAKKISTKDVTLLPLVHVQNRKHFNTLLLHADAQNILHVYLIESRGSNKTGLFSSYPVEGLGQEIEKHFKNQSQEIKFKNPMIGVQAFFDDKTCGAHQINFIEAIIQLSPKEILDEKYLIECLKQTKLESRNDDSERARFVAGFPLDHVEPSKEVEVNSVPSREEKEEGEENIFFDKEVKEDLMRNSSSYEEIPVLDHHSLQEAIRRREGISAAIKSVGGTKSVRPKK